MFDIAYLRTILSAYPEVTEEPHFDKISFRVKKKIFATYNAKEHRACFKLSAIDQDVFTTVNKPIVWQVPNAWGKQGWTLVSLIDIREEVLKDICLTAYCHVAPAKLAALIS